MVDLKALSPNVDINALLKKYRGVWSDKEEGSVSFKNDLDRDNFMIELAALEAAERGDDTLSALQEAVSKADHARKAIDWLQSHGMSITKPSSLMTPNVVLSIKTASSLTGFREADHFIQKAFEAALPGIISAAITMAKQADKESRAAIRELGSKV